MDYLFVSLLLSFYLYNAKKIKMAVCIAKGVFATAKNRSLDK